MRVGFVGLGTMGLPMARCLAGAGFDVLGFDVDPAARQRGSGGGLATAVAVDGLAAAGAVVTMLPDGQAVREAILGDWLPPGVTVIDCSSSDPQDTVETAARLAAQEVAMIDAPVSGNPARALLGQLTLMVGGDDPIVERVQPVLEALGRVRRSGGLGSGHALKALNNLLSCVNLAAAAEVMLVGRRFGLDPAVMLATINASTGRNDATENKLGQFVLSGSFDSGFRMRLMRKDLEIALAIAQRGGMGCAFGEHCARVWDGALGALGDGADNVEVVRWMEETSRVTLEPGSPQPAGQSPVGSSGGR